VEGGDGVGFIDDEVFSPIVMGLRHRKRETEQETQENIQATAGGFKLGTILAIAAPEVEAEIHAQKET
jgi:hypothetical protein